MAVPTRHLHLCRRPVASCGGRRVGMASVASARHRSMNSLFAPARNVLVAQ
ncbi:hypothetical protein E2C01_056501 [Portunus trituberculatus]|uniref:Uncharacterized protein n=1 Tax=Portunus trituberculatus TaxID=210409 RepID=A0A5B7GZC4_PORTR|nr:hypothetical protein [Portunus trituberculatus]